MCGITGLIAREKMDIGVTIVDMLYQLKHRGKDATGLAFYEDRKDIEIKVAMDGKEFQPHLESMISDCGKISNVRTSPSIGGYTFFEASIAMDYQKIPELHKKIDAEPQLCVHHLGQRIKVYKDVGDAGDLRGHYDIRGMSGTHGIGHVRLATESIENINFAHPLVSYIYPELAIVHNGQLTNYFNMRRKLENLGVQFKTYNDSELIAHYLAYQMKERGKDLEEALWMGLEAFDGVFTFLASTPDQIGAVRDKLAIKPVLFYESEEKLFMFGSEQTCMAPIMPDIFATEMDPGGAKVWSV
ncbi:MAG: glutamine amidotransferase [Proteobacteria bacterium]|nr:glutamine amidotransferase [Pseudomonadota bacterium]